MQPARAPAAPAGRPARRGFSLIELLLAVVILGVLAVVALPAFQDQMRKSRRADAFAALAQVQQAQERWRASQPAYATTLASLGLAGLGTATAQGLYSVAIDAAGASSYRITATALSTGSQAGDDDCQRLRVEMNAGTLAYLSACASCGSTFTATGGCWAR